MLHVRLSAVRVKATIVASHNTISNILKVVLSKGIEYRSGIGTRSVKCVMYLLYIQCLCRHSVGSLVRRYNCTVSGDKVML